MQVCFNMTLKTHLLRRINKHLTKQNKSQKEKELEFRESSRKTINQPSFDIAEADVSITNKACPPATMRQAY